MRLPTAATGLLAAVSFAAWAPAWAAPPAAPSPWADCIRAAADGAGTAAWRCGTIELQATRLPPGATEEQRAATEAFAGGPAAERTRIALSVAGASRQVLRSIGAPAPQLAAVYTLALPTPEATLLLVCAAWNADAPDRCAAGLDELARDGELAGARPAPTLAGAVVPMPQGCWPTASGPTEGAVECAGGEMFRWIAAPPEWQDATKTALNVRFLAGEVREAAAAQAGAGEVAQAHPKCTVRGGPAECVDTTFPDRTGRRGMLVALAPIGDAVYVVSCSRGKAGGALPEVCAPLAVAP